MAALYIHMQSGTDSQRGAVPLGRADQLDVVHVLIALVDVGNYAHRFSFVSEAISSQHNPAHCILG